MNACVILDCKESRSEVINAMSVLQLLKDFCTYDFVYRDCERALSVLSEDIRWFGTSDYEDVYGKDAARAYINNEIVSMPASYRMFFQSEAETPLDGGSSEAFLRVTLEAEGVRILCRVTASSRTENGAERLCAMHFSISDDDQQPGEYFPLIEGREKLDRENIALVASTL